MSALLTCGSPALCMESRTQLSDFPFTFHFHALEKQMATHSSVLAWRIPGTGREQSRTPLHHTHGDLTSLAPPERLSELPVVPREKSDTGATAGENPRDAPVIAR